ncbi:MAG: AAA family ATPase [Clostridia bacterium]|nr:AAA family ATPase [Clostridia bacterium]
MAVYLSSFRLPDGEDGLIRKQSLINSGQYRLVGDKLEITPGSDFGYIDNIYPCGIFGEMQLECLLFSRVTIFYGGNGSGKSTLLNLIANKLELKRSSPHNSGELFDAYTEACDYELGCDDEGEPLAIPEGSRIVTSDDVFDYMLAVRANNQDIGEAIARGKAEYAELKFGNTIRLSGLEDYEALRLQVQARSRTLSRRRFLRRNVGEEARLYSNGETALRYFDEMLKFDTLYLLDEPENSMAPGMQLRLAERLEELARFGGCQLMIATHSPFLLSLPGAKIYDLDSRPAKTKKWWELENTRIYFDFFNKHRALFEGGE